MITLLETDGIRIRAEETDGYHFLHLDVEEWGLSAYREIKKSIAEIRKAYSKNGVEVLFARTDDEKIVKFWGRVHPLDEVKKFGPHDEYYLGVWLTGDE